MFLQQKDIRIIVINDLLDSLTALVEAMHVKGNNIKLTDCIIVPRRHFYE